MIYFGVKHLFYGSGLTFHMGRFLVKEGFGFILGGNKCGKGLAFHMGRFLVG